MAGGYSTTNVRRRGDGLQGVSVRVGSTAFPEWGGRLHEQEGRHGSDYHEDPGSLRVRLADRAHRSLGQG